VRPYLLQSGVSGTAVGPEIVRRSTDCVLSAGIALIDTLATAEVSRAASVSFGRLVDQPLDRLVEALALKEASQLVQSSKELLDPLRRASVPAVLEHGDFGHPNLIIAEGRRMAAVDWERFERKGLPGLDLVFFLQYVKECTASAITIESQLLAFDAAFVGSDAWAGEFLRHYAARLRIPQTLLPHLVLATWCRTVAGLVTRLEPSGSSSRAVNAAPRQHLADTVTGDRDYALWRHAVARFERILG